RQIYVGALRGFARSARKPGLHVRCGADRALGVKHNAGGQGVFKANGFPDVLNDLGHVESKQDATAKVVLAEEWRRDGDQAASEVILGDADELGKEEFAIAFPSGLHPVIDFGGSLKNDALHALLFTELLQIDGGQLSDIRLAVYDGS